MNILIVGLGSIARKHIDAIKSLEIAPNIYALRSDPNSSVEDDVVNIYSIEKIDIEFDFAIISNPTKLHFKYIKILAEKGIHLFIEKPALDSIEKSEDLIKIVESKNIFSYVACNLRFHPCLIFINNLLQFEQPRINEVNVYCGSYLPDWRPGKNFREIYSANRSMGGGVHLDLFHEVDYITWLFGLPHKSNRIIRNASSLEIDAIDYANYSLEYEEFAANIVLNYYRKKPKRTMELVLSDRAILIDLVNNKITDDSGNVIFHFVDFNMNQTYFDQMNYFVECLKEKVKPMNSMKESIDVLKVVL